MSSHADTIRLNSWCGQTELCYDNPTCDVHLLLAENQRLREALERISEEQPQVLAKLEQNGIVFDDLGADPKNWQHVAFTIYNHLCSVDLAAREALAGDAE